MKPKQEDQKEMVGGCCVCSDENGWTENPLVYCDGQGCNVAVHQACYGIVTVPTGSWFCRKCESQERAARVRCELCPSKDGALKRTDSGGWAHVVCALYIPEVRFGNVTTMEPIMLQLVPPERFNKTCYICEESSKGNGGSNKAQMGACMQCNRQGCKNNFHVTCAQALGLLCEEAGNYLDNVKYCGYCSYHYSKLDKEKDNSSTSEMDKEKDKQRKMRRNGSKTPLAKVMDADASMSNDEESPTKEGALMICEEKNLSIDAKDKINKGKSSPEDNKLNVQFTPNVSVTGHLNKSFNSVNCETSAIGEPAKRSRSSSQDRGRRNKRGGGACGIGGNSKRGRLINVTKEPNIKEQQDSEDSSPESFSAESYQLPKRSRTKKLDIKDIKEPISISSILTNGMATNALLLGNQINPSSAVAQKMQDTLHAEMEAHSIYNEEKVAMSLVGPALPGKRETLTPGAILNSTQPPPLPQSLEQLLERQWEQGSQFLMEQAQHFDIASLLSCLHQLRQENVRLEETVNSLIARRDHLLAVNARLSVPLTSTISTSQTSTSGSTPSASSSLTTSLASHPSSLASSIVSITPTGLSAAPLSASALGVSHINQLGLSQQHTGVTTSSLASTMCSRPHSQGRPPSGGNISHSAMPTTPVGRGTSPHDRRVAQQGLPLENGLGEPEYRYRSPGSSIEHQHRQQSPMLPPGAQPSPTSMRQSPASTNYHSGTSPHTGMPTLSPSGISHGMPPHTLVAHTASHGQHPIMVSSSHGPGQHLNVSMSRGSSDHVRAELVRLSSSSQPNAHSNPGIGGYPSHYSMVSPTVPGQHHSPVTMSQHPPPPHTQVMRRETVVDSSRGNHSTLEKR